MCISGRVMAANVCQEFRDHYHIYRAGWNRLCEQALAAGVCRWPVKPKHHYVEHMALDTTPLNPRYMHNFVCEDMVRRIKSLAVHSHPAYLSKHVVSKYTLQCCLRWRENEAECSEGCRFQISWQAPFRASSVGSSTATCKAHGFHLPSVFFCLHAHVHTHIYISYV